MAATLIYLKSKLLVPPDETEEQLDDEALALKQELEERLREYARVKTQGAWLAHREAEQALVWGRPSSTLPRPRTFPLEDLSVHWLERTLKRLIEEQQRLRPREVEAQPALGAGAHERDPVPAARHVVAAVHLDDRGEAKRSEAS